MSLLKIVLLAGTSAVGGATVAALLARYWWVFDLFSHFRIQYVVSALILLVLAVWLRSVSGVIALLAIAGIHGFALSELWLSPKDDVDTGRPSFFELATANVLRTNPEKRRVVELVRATQPDLLVLVEAHQPDWREPLREIGAIYSHAAPPRWQLGAPVILFSRYPLTAVQVDEPPAGQRPFLLAEVAMPAGRLIVVGIHPASPSPGHAESSWVRNLQLEDLETRLEEIEGPLIVTGDFNTSPFSPHFADLVQSADLRNAAAGFGYYGTWPQSFWPARIPIDHVLIRGPLQAVSFETGPPTGSDHLPIFATLRMTRPSFRRRRSDCPALPQRRPWASVDRCEE